MAQSGKIVIIGSGHVGSHCASALAAYGICSEIVLLDKEETIARAHAADIADGAAMMPQRTTVRAGGYSECADADIVVMAAGVSRKPGQTRLDMLGDTIAIMQDIVPRLKKSGFGGIVVSISNPADVVADYLRAHLGLPARQVFSTGTALDSARLRRILSERYQVDGKSVQAFAMGEHGDSQMIPFSAITLGGVPLSLFDPDPPKAALLERTRLTGMEIVIGKGSTEFGIGMILAQFVRAILRDERCILPASPLLEGQYGISGLHAGVPCIIGKHGVEQILELPLTAEELEQFRNSTQVIGRHVELAKTL